MKCIKYGAMLSYNSRRQSKKGFIHTVASVLRMIAEKVDGQKAIVVDFDSCPKLNEKELAEVVRFGMKEMEKGFVEVVKNKAVENTMKQQLNWVGDNEIYESD